MQGLRVLLVNHEARLRGGAESLIQREQAYLEENGYAVRSVGLDGDGVGELFTDEVVREPRSEIVREIGGLSVSLTVYRGLRSVVRSFDPDVVHVHKSQKYPATIALATRGYPSMKTHHDFSTVCPSSWGVKRDTLEVCECGVGAKCWRHGCRSAPVILGYYVPRHKVQLRIERAIIDSHVAPGATLTRYLNEFGYEATQVPNPETVEPVSDAPDEGYFLFVGRIDEAKGVDVLVKAVRLLQERSLDPDVKIVGTGPYEDELRRKVETHCPETIELLGYVSGDPKRDLYSRARAVVVPSIGLESFGLVVLEAMAHAKPVIGSDRGGIREIVEDGVTGLLYPATDPSALADRIERLAADGERAAELGRAGRERVAEDYTYEKFGSAIETRLHEVAGTGDRGAVDGSERQ